MDEILDFCAHCGSLLPESLVDFLDEDCRCDHCDNRVNERGDRIQGTFTSEEAKKMKEAWD